MAGKRRVFGAAFKAKVALAAAKGDRTTAQLASQFGIHTSQVTAWKKLLMAQVAELFADGRQRRADQATDEQELLTAASARTYCHGMNTPSRRARSRTFRSCWSSDRGFEFSSLNRR